MDTIFALASAPGRAGVSVIRISGDDALVVAKNLVTSLPKNRQNALREIRDLNGELLDQALVLRFDGPQSFTGEDVIELHLHGSIAIVKSVLSALSATGKARLAEPGEFTRRALENGKMDLSQVEGLADLIESETESQRKQALRVVSGEFGARVEAWRQKLIRSAALIEATIDFADEDVPVDVSPEVLALLNSVVDELQREINGSKIAERVRSGFEVAIVGAPNAGKSTLLNAISGREAAITSEIAGTTRDIIEVRMDLNGIPVTILDTAGLRECADIIEGIGIDRAVERANQADLRIFLAQDDEVLLLDQQIDDIRVAPKADVTGHGVSGKTGEGVAALLEEIQTKLEGRVAQTGLATHERHRVAMSSAYELLNLAISNISLGPEHYDIIAEDLRSAIRSLEALVGRIDVENLLDEIFSSFCLGK